MPSTKLYEFRQNNSGGRFINTPALAETVYIEAVDVDDANERAEIIGIYFNGVENCIDCECCGDRWSRAYELDSFDSVKDITIGQWSDGAYTAVSLKTATNNPNVVVYYIDGRKEDYRG